jgi:hypothetical protein
MVPPENEVKEILRQFHNLIYDIIESAWQDWLESSEFPRTRTSRTRANIVWEQMINRATEVFANNPDVRIRQHNNTFSFIFREKVLLRFKKCDDRGYSANYPTQMALAFHDHEHDQLNLFDFGDYYRVEALYVLDELQLEVDHVLIQARNNSHKAWEYEIQSDGSLAGDITITFPTPPEPAEPQLLEPLIEEKRSEENE